MAPEPSHLVNITKTCPRCDSTNVKFAYLNNYKESQPRYKCRGPICRGRRFFTYGGKLRPKRVPKPPPIAWTTPTSTAVVVAAADPADHRHHPRPAAASVGPRRSQRLLLMPDQGEELLETPSTCARTDANFVAARSRLARPATGALRLRRGSKSEKRAWPSLVQGPAIERPADQGPVQGPAVVHYPVLAAGDSEGLSRGDIVDADPPATTRTAHMARAQGGDSDVDWAKAVLELPPYALLPAVARQSNKRLKRMRIKCDGEETVVHYWV